MYNVLMVFILVVLLKFKCVVINIMKMITELFWCLFRNLVLYADVLNKQ